MQLSSNPLLLFFFFSELQVGSLYAVNKLTDFVRIGHTLKLFLLFFSGFKIIKLLNFKGKK